MVMHVFPGYSPKSLLLIAYTASGFPQNLLLPSLPSPSSKQWPSQPVQKYGLTVQSPMSQFCLMFQMVHISALKPGPTKVLAAPFTGIRSHETLQLPTWSVLVLPNGHKQRLLSPGFTLQEN